MAVLSSTSVLPPRVQATYDRVLLERAVAYNVHARFGQSKSIKKRSGTQMIFRRYNALAPATTPLTEGVTPAGKQLSKTDVTVTLNFYGDYVTIPDVVDMTVEDDVLVEAKQIQGEQAGETLDILTRDVLVAGTSVLYPAGVTARASIADDDFVDEDILKRAQRFLKRNNGKFISEMISASTGVGTQPVWKAFAAITHPDVEMYLRSLSNYKNVGDYSDAKRAEEGEDGSFQNLRFFCSTNAKVYQDAGGAVGAGTKRAYSTSGTNADVYTILVFAQNAYGVTRLGDKGIEAIVQPFGSGGTADPLKQRATSGWKTQYASVILQDLWMVRLEFALPVNIG
jgi:N4-gp56 family major capsid protein